MSQDNLLNKVLITFAWALSNEAIQLDHEYVGVFILKGTFLANYAYLTPTKITVLCIQCEINWFPSTHEFLSNNKWRYQQNKGVKGN